jgi:ABC-type transport system involved in multi-copper enzyme maturation permease subunit
MVPVHSHRARDLLGVLAAVTGPVFEKERRVWSRRGRLYVLRCVYLAALTAFLAAVWTGEVGGGGGAASAYGLSRMSVIGQRITADILIFQFFLLPLVAAVVLSTSILEESRRRTLEALLATPVGDFQIVFGKLLGGLLQVALLMAVSLPILVVVRVFGGVEWRWVAAGFGVTLTTCLFVGSLSLLVSTWTRRAYAAVLVVMLILAALFLLHGIGVLGLTLAGAVDPSRRDGWLAVALGVPNPYFAFREALGRLSDPLGRSAASACLWPVHCGLALSASVLLLRWAGRRLRQVGLPPARGAPLSNLRRTWRSAATWSRRGFGSVGVWGGLPISPVLWREIRTCVIPSRRLAWLLGSVIVGGVLAADLGTGFHGAGMTAAVLLLFAALVTAPLAATGIAWEKEAGTLDVLLSTPLAIRQIIWGKTAGAIRRAWIAWAPLAVHLGLCVVFCQAHPIVLLHATLVAAGTISVVAGTGAYLSARCSRAATAAATNLVLSAVFLGHPLAWYEGFGLWRSYPLANTILFVINPLSQMGITVSGAEGYTLAYHWLGESASGWLTTTLVVGATSLAWYLAGWLLLSRLAGRRLRKGGS